MFPTAIEKIKKNKGFVITHGHEDHIRPLPYILPQLNVPVYATRLTMGLIEHKLKEANLIRKTRRKVVKQGGYVVLGDMRVEFIKTNHSIAVSLCPRHLYAGRRHSPPEISKWIIRRFWRTHRSAALKYYW